MRLLLAILLLLVNRALPRERQSLEGNLPIANDHSLNEIETDINHRMQRIMYKNLTTEPFKNTNSRQFDNERESHLSDRSGEHCEHHFKAWSLGDEKSICSVPLVDTMQ